jgi:hypothetical protein
VGPPGAGGGPTGPQRPPGKGWWRSRRLRWGAAIAAVLLLAAGGTAAALRMTSTPANAAQAVALNSALAALGRGCPSGDGASAHGNGGQGKGGHGNRAGHRGCLGRQLRAVKGMYGEVAFHTATGTQTLVFERGAVTSASGSQLTVRAANGTQWNWSLASGSVIRQRGRSIPASQLASGTRVFVGGQVAEAAGTPGWCSCT